MTVRDIALAALAEDAAVNPDGELPRSPTPSFDLQKFINYLEGKDE